MTTCCPKTGPPRARLSAKPRGRDEYHAAPRARDPGFLGRLPYSGALGNTLAALDDSNQITAAFTYGPFGEILDQVGSATGDHLRRFNGKEQDQLSSLSYYGARYYDPLSLSWTQADPLYRFAPDLAYDQPRRMNLYSFSLNNPLVYIDPSGLKGKRHVEDDKVPAEDIGQIKEFRSCEGVEPSEHGIECGVILVDEKGKEVVVAKGALKGVDTADLNAVQYWLRSKGLSVSPDTIESLKGAGILLAALGGAYAGLKAGLEALEDSLVSEEAAAAGAAGTEAAEVEEGIYEFTGQSGKKYVGQSGNISRRIGEHARSGKLPPGAEVKRTAVSGGRPPEKSLNSEESTNLVVSTILRTR